MSIPWRICSLVEKELNIIKLLQSLQNLQIFIRVIIKHGNFIIGVIKIEQYRMNQELKLKKEILKNKYSRTSSKIEIFKNHYLEFFKMARDEAAAKKKEQKSVVPEYLFFRI